MRKRSIGKEGIFRGQWKDDVSWRLHVNVVEYGTIRRKLTYRGETRRDIYFLRTQILV